MSYIVRNSGLRDPVDMSRADEMAMLPLTPAARALSVAESIDAAADVGARFVRSAVDRALTPTEEEFARQFVVTRNAAEAYRRAHEVPDMPQRIACSNAYQFANRPAVMRRVRELEIAAAAGMKIDLQALFEADARIVAGFNHVEQVSSYVWQCCRYCRGIEHKYQWIDVPEYCQALLKAEEENEARAARKRKPLPLPSDDGGYGFAPGHDPVITCPQCEGRGVQVVVLADTTRLEGAAKAIVKGVRVTPSGTEILLHDVDKAKERLLRAAGAFGDDAASVARGAAAGAAAGAGAAAALNAAAGAETMTAEKAARLYLQLAG